MAWYQPKTTTDKFFVAGIIVKGFTGLLEFLGGLFLLFFSVESLRSFIAVITQRELLEDPKDLIANYLVHATQGFGAAEKAFLIVYLWVHAAVKLIAVIGILRNLAWAYPFSLITLGLLLLYQIYDMIFVKFSVGIFLLSVFDIIVLGLIWYEYRKMRHKNSTE